MTKLKIAVGTVVVAGVAATLVFEHQALTKLRMQNKTLQPQRVEDLKAAPLASVPRLRLPAPKMPQRNASTSERPSSGSESTDAFTRMVTHGKGSKLTPAQIENYLAQSHRSAESLSTAFRLTGDRTFLEEAAKSYSTDPRVDYAGWFATLRNGSASTEERRQWLDAFKRADPDNALASYLSAQDYFQSGQNDLAVQELIAATGKSKFENYLMDSVQNTEEAYRSAGYSEVEAKWMGLFNRGLMELWPLRDLGQNFAELAELYRRAGDEQSAAAAQQMGLTLGQQIAQGPYMLQNMAGLAIERSILQNMDPTSPYNGTGCTVQQRLDEIAQAQQAIKDLGSLGPERLLQSLSEQDLISFFERMKVFGQRAATEWAMTRLVTAK